MARTAKGVCAELSSPAPGILQQCMLDRTARGGCLCPRHRDQDARICHAVSTPRVFLTCVFFAVANRAGYVRAAEGRAPPTALPIDWPSAPLHPHGALGDPLLTHDVFLPFCPPPTPPASPVIRRPVPCHVSP